MIDSATRQKTDAFDFAVAEKTDDSVYVFTAKAGDTTGVRKIYVSGDTLKVKVKAYDFSKEEISINQGDTGSVVLNLGGLKDSLRTNSDGFNFTGSSGIMIDSVRKGTVYMSVTKNASSTFYATLNYLNNGHIVATCRVKVTPTSNIPVGALSGKFSVSASKQVYFSKGNLQTKIDASGNPLASNWKFAAHQYDTIGRAGANHTIGTAGGDVDLFCWSTDADFNNWGIHTKETATTGYTDGEFKDWGKAYCGVKGITPDTTWRTLTGGGSGEWKYLLESRSGDKAPEIGSQTDARYAEVKVNDICGLLIFPDVFTWPSEVTKQPTTFNTNSSDWNDVNYSLADFEKLESAGCVFLPAAGYRFGSAVSNVGDYGSYWSSTAADDADYAYSLYFISDGVGPANYFSRLSGYSVRLVSVAK